MKFYTKDNIVMYQGEVISLDVIGEVYDGLTEEEKRKSRKLDHSKITDIEISDWLLDNIFKKEKEDSWIVDSLHTGTSDIPYFRIEKDESGEVYCFTRGGKCLMYMGYVRELQNIYHLYSDYEDGDYLNDDIDEKIKKLFKLI